MERVSQRKARMERTIEGENDRYDRIAICTANGLRVNRRRKRRRKEEDAQ